MLYDRTVYRNDLYTIDYPKGPPTPTQIIGNRGVRVKRLPLLYDIVTQDLIK